MFSRLLSAVALPLGAISLQRVVVLPVPPGSRAAGWWKGGLSGGSRAREESEPHPGPRRRSSDPVLDDPEACRDPEAEVQRLVSEESRKQKVIKLQRMARRMSPPCPPERTLTWDAMEQMRFLRQESPEEWTVPRLAEGFSVTPEVVRRVLRSRFTPPVSRRQKQDARALGRTGGAATMPGRLGVGSAQTPLPPGTQPTLSSGESAGQQVLGVLAQVGTLSPHSAAPHNPLGFGDPPPTQHPRGTLPPEWSGDGRDFRAGEEDRARMWVSEVLTEEELQHLAAALGGEGTPPPPVVQEGREFYDSEGNFLYRI
ncbi:neugrin [Amia ocellicauda]|uniref:neugrin n=1 Tax=Amia ocellicauda TaxID=2972642 RepID=UPI0034643949